MTETVYPTRLTSFETNVVPEPVIEIDVMTHGRRALEEINKRMGLAFDDWDLQVGNISDIESVVDAGLDSGLREVRLSGHLGHNRSLGFSTPFGEWFCRRSRVGGTVPSVHQAAVQLGFYRSLLDYLVACLRSLPDGLC